MSGFDMNRKLSLVQARSTRPASRNKAQARFDRLIREIEQGREQLRQWQALDERCLRRVREELGPLQDEWRAKKRTLVQRIDGLLTTAPVGRPLGKVQRAKLVQFLCSVTQGLLAEPGAAEDAELIALFDRYSDLSHRELAEEELDFTRAVLGGVFGAEVIDQVEAKTAEDLLDQAEERITARLEEDARRHAQARENRPPGPAAAQQAQAKQAISQSIREVYRKLASRLHPDREPDPAERERKTALMQRVNQAHDQRDLLTLLSLQIEIEQISADDLAAVPDERMAHYNAVLTEQRDQLRDEVDACAARYAVVTGEDFYGKITLAQVEASLTREIAQMRHQITVVNRDLAGFADRKYLADWLKGYALDRAPGRGGDESDDLDLKQAMALMKEAMNAMAEQAPRRSPGRPRR